MRYAGILRKSNEQLSGGESCNCILHHLLSFTGANWSFVQVIGELGGRGKLARGQMWVSIVFSFSLLLVDKVYKRNLVK